MPMESEKKLWPIALMSTFPSIFEKSGLKKKRIPSAAPGIVSDLTQSTTMMTSSSGINILDHFSMPSFTPRATTMAVSARNASWHTTGSQGWVVKAANCSCICARSLPAKWLAAALPR